ncbi:MAG TPA: DUF6305 family protein [Bacillota bacterium]|nr:hypothetical protein [Bacillota bacterium]HOA15975.1 DUF6305 family protein [Bacillota bacterium]HOG52492.1 DUF6305 family protein [Bacillota bacterium]
MRKYTYLAAFAIIAAMLLGMGGAYAATPLLITNVGQGAESAMVNTLCKMNKITADLKDTVTADELADAAGKAKYSFMAVVVGYSGKGMGAAGVNLEQELARANSVLKKAQALKIPVIIMHIGGFERRGANSDPIIKEVFKYANHAIFVASGNYADAVAFENKKPDNLLNNSLPKGVTPKIVDKISGIVAPLKEIMGL